MSDVLLYSKNKERLLLKSPRREIVKMKTIYSVNSLG